MAFREKDHDPFLKSDTFSVWDDFFNYTNGDTFTTLASDGGTCAVSDGVAGYLKVYPSSAENSEGDNEEAYLKGTTEMFKFATGKPLVFATCVRPYANTVTGINLAVGLKNAVTDDVLVNNGAVPVITGSGAFFYKLDGGTVWRCTATANGSEATTNGVITKHTVGNNAFDVLVITTKPLSSTETEIHFFSADVQSDGDYNLNEVGKMMGGRYNNQLVAQKVTHTSATEMEIMLGCKNGTADDSQHLDVDWVYAAQKR